jgi:parvulin-like peptidyl-prolyl isomerase
MSNRARSASGLAAALVWAACQRPPQPVGPDVAAHIDADAVGYGEFANYLSRTVGGSEGELSAEVTSELFDQFLDELLLARLARDRGLVAAATAPRLATDALLRRYAPAAPRDREIADFYRLHRAEFARPERVRLRQLLTQDRARAESARREIVAGADFDAVARRLTPALQTGLQGELSRADLPPALVDVIFSLREGEVSTVVPESYGFHVFQVVARLPGEVAPLETVREEIRARLRQASADRTLRVLVQQARARYNVTVYEGNLPFRYGGYYENARKH